ncbi:hypothetical protein IW148_006195 [Coemansia sp. RSA 1199]|nr:hypothetical protein IW148_006195 [Coemansia sp. RSA 1199]
MDIVPLVSTIASCVEPGSVDRHLLHQRLTELVLAVRNAKATNVDSTSLLTHITLVAARLVSHRVELSDRERELVLETVQEALTSKAHRPLFNVHAVVVDHIGRILVPLFVAPSALPEATRLLAINAWRQLVKVASVHVPEKHSTQKSRQLPCTLSLCDYIKEFMPPDYLSLAVCALLDNAETADDQRLRVRALEALLDLFQKDGLVDRVSMSSMFPGTVSALTRIALAQLPANSQNAPKRPISAVRTQAFHALEAAILVMYRGSHTLDKADVAEEWAQQARGGPKSIVDVDATQTNEPDRLQQILWRLASLRHNSGTLSALFSLFARVSSLECASRMPEGCVQVAVETCLAVAGQQPDLASSYLLDLKLRCSEGDSVGARVEAVLEPLLKQFERFVTNGEPRQRSDVLCVISACVRVLGQHRALPLVSPWWRSQGLPALLTSLSVSLPGTSLLISDTQEPLDDVSYVLDNYRTTELSHALDQFVQSMADLITPREMGAQLLSLLFDSSDRHVSVLWMLRKVAGQATLGDLSSICPSAFQYCVDFCGSAPDPDTDTSQRAAHELMVLDVVSTLVPLIGPNVAYYMDTLLFPLLQTTMASSPALQAQAHRVLDILAQQTSSTVAHMLHDNVDYIVEGCSQQIRSVALHPRVFSILCGAVQLVGKDILVYMDDVVEDTLDVCERLAYEDDEIVTGALQLLEIVTRTVADEPKMIEESTKGRVEMLDPDPIASAIKAMDDAAASRMLEDLVLTDPIPELPTSIADPEPNDMEPNNDAEPEDDTKPEGNPLAIKICLAIQSFLYTDSSAHQLLALKTVHNSTSALQTTRDLLPLLNEVWPSLVNRLNQRDAHYVTLAACDVIERVCVLGSSWMRKRVKDDLWPHFERILWNTPLKMQRSESVLARRILLTMSKVVEYVTLDEGMAWTVCVLVVRFFGSDVEPELIELLQKMVPVYGDKVWLVLAKLGRVDGVQPNAILDIGVSSNIKPPVGICQMLGL